jgi:hypothetical protein
MIAKPIFDELTQQRTKLHESATGSSKFWFEELTFSLTIHHLPLENAHVIV